MTHQVACALAVVAAVLMMRTDGRSEELAAEQRYQELADAYIDAQKNFEQALAAAKSDTGRSKIINEFATAAVPSRHAGDFVKLIQDHPNDPISISAFRWLLANNRSGRENSAAASAFGDELLKTDHALQLCRSARLYASGATETVLRRVIQVNRLPSVQGYARYGLALSLKDQAQLRRPNAKRDARQLGEAEQLLTEIVRDYADVEVGSKPLRSLVEPELFEIRHLTIGKTAPEIEGEDIDGRPLRLSDHRGKVVLLVFWATWCGPCMADVPHQRSLVEKYEGKPFVLLGINGDDGRTLAKEAVEQHKINWRSWFAKGAKNPIAAKWNVRSWPTIYLLDGKGTIRFKGDYLRGSTFELDNAGKPQRIRRLDSAIAELVREADAGH